MGTWILSHGKSGQCVKLATSVKVKNKWNYISAFPLYIYGMDRNIFTLIIYLFISVILFLSFNTLVTQLQVRPTCECTSKN